MTHTSLPFGFMLPVIDNCKTRNLWKASAQRYQGFETFAPPPGHADNAPFAGEDYAWADAEGITSTFVWLVTRAVDTAAQLAKHLNDDAALLAVATAGLRMMPGDEHFSQLRDDSVSAAT